MKRILAFLLLISSLSARAADIVTPASDSRITVIGRTLAKGDDVSFDWTGVYVRVAFEGKYIALRASDTKKNYYNVWLDKDTSCEPDKVITTFGSDSLIVLFDGIKGKGVHNLTLQKRTEAEQGKTTLHCFVTRGPVVQAEPLRPRLIEFVGDSYTCGYGTESLSRSDPFKPETENANKTYATILSRYFGADYMLVAHSGQGIDRNYGDFGRGFAMPERYLNTFDCVEGSPAWKPSAQKPDLTVIYLCTNDFSTGRQPTIGEFRRHYIQLLKTIKDNYGPAHKILCIAGPSDELMPQYVRSAVEASGLEQVWSVNLCPMAINIDSDLGASWHPNYAGQTKWAYALLPYVATITGWGLQDSILR
ncbi:MAG: GDSL family lipase [Bacteroidales bacterium]|nr:GDSL family lipase [Bacteroidales bacterium]